MAHIFGRSGLARLSDLKSPEWRAIYTEMERVQAEFLRHESAFRSTEYPWPRDPLHSWSRMWEYPYSFHHLSAFRRAWNRPGEPLVADIGSGVTFFPFAVGRLGCRVVCIDNDPICEKDLMRAADHVSATPGEVGFRLTDGATLPLGDSEADAIYCISVLEHIPQFEQTVAEMARALRPGGLLVLTVDIDLLGNFELGADQYQRLCESLERSFILTGHLTAHPRDVLDSRNSPFPMPPDPERLKTWFRLKQRIRPLFGRESNHSALFYLAVCGFVATRRA